MDIDLVYLWVDGNDPEWLARKNAFLPADKQVDPQAAGECRYAENDELRYSLRSVELYAPWVRRIYIVTDDQTPAWLDTSNPRVRVMSHREIMPAEILPVFNSTVIELFLARIPGLSEHFLYANDDMFFSAPVDPGFFFDARGLPIVRLKKQSLKRHPDDIYCYTILRMQELVKKRYGKCTPLAPHHNVDASVAAITWNAVTCFRRHWPGIFAADSARSGIGNARWYIIMPLRKGVLRCVG